MLRAAFRISARGVVGVRGVHMQAHTGIPEIKSRLNFKRLATNVEAMQRNVQDRNMNVDVRRVVELYDGAASIEHSLNETRAERNRVANAVTSARSHDERAELVQQGKALKEAVTRLEHELFQQHALLEVEALRVPNSTHPTSPVGPESAAVRVATVGSMPEFRFVPKDHLELAALMEMALVQWSMHRLVQRGFTPVLGPDLVHHQMVEGCGFHPRGESSQVYAVANSNLCLVGTAEIPCAGMLTGKLMDAEALPLKLAAFGHCFRTEAGAGGADTRGLYRLHQFSKVEMFTFTTPEESERMLEEIVDVQKALMGELGLHCRVLDMPTEELGASAYKKFDIEAYMPGRQLFGEVTSASNCTNYQSRRLNIRYRPTPTAKPRYVHTLNGTACAVPRTIIAIMETHQQEDGTIVVPPALRPYMMGIERIGKIKA